MAGTPTTAFQNASASLIPLVPAESIAEIRARQRRRQQSLVPELWALIDRVKDPEIPALSIWEMGILQNIELTSQVLVTITPTYSGCPAMDLIEEDIQAVLAPAGYKAKVVTQLSPAWTSAWMTPEAQELMRQSGIAPPDDIAGGCSVRGLQVRCPQCGSADTRVLSAFGSTACKALLQCRRCGEPFDYFKRI